MLIDDVIYEIEEPEEICKSYYFEWDDFKMIDIAGNEIDLNEENKILE